ncbi:hypothetical protein V866_004214 [Kwoniella sp. B9012]
MTESFLPIIEAVDNFPYDLFPSTYIPFHLTLSDHQNKLPPIGLLRQGIVEEMSLVVERIWEFEYSSAERKVICVYFNDDLIKKGREEISRVMAEVIRKWKNEGKFSKLSSGRCKEDYDVYASSKSSGLQEASSSEIAPDKNIAFHLKDAACALFGIATFGTHMTAYEGEGKDMKVWVPTRSQSKATWPGRLDNSVAGSMGVDETPLETMIRECEEEASLPSHFVRKYLKNGGVTTHFYISDDGFLQPEVSYIYDLPLPPTSSSNYVKLKPNDDEVQSFALMSIPELIETLHTGRFKPNCALILVDFLIRHGFITPENEPNFLQISWRLRRVLPVALPGI